MAGRRIRKELQDRIRQFDFDTEYIPFFDERYFNGKQFDDTYGYDDYHECKRLLGDWASMVDDLFQPASVLDVGAAYGFVVEWFRLKRIRADGVEPSPFARSQSSVDLYDGYLPEHMPVLTERYHTVVCTEVLEHMPADLVPSALAALVKNATNYVACLPQMGEWDQYHEDPTHIQLRPRDWWENHFNHVDGWEIDQELSTILNVHPTSKAMRWSGRFIVLAPQKR